MTIEERLKHLMLARYQKLTTFAKVAEVPYTTLDSILKRGLDRAGMQNVCKICRCLEISVDELGNGEIVPRKNVDMNFSPDERELIRKYRELDERGKRTVEETVEREYRFTHD